MTALNQATQGMTPTAPLIRGTNAAPNYELGEPSTRLQRVLIDTKRLSSKYFWDWLGGIALAVMIGAWCLAV